MRFVLMILLVLPMSAADPGGASLFDRRCGGCHTLDAAKIGPPLRNVYGNRSGSYPGFPYSAGLKRAGLVWNKETLDKWLEDPTSVVPDTDMALRMPKADERSTIIGYLQTAIQNK